MWKIGDRVLGRKGSEPFWYAGTVRHIDGHRSYVIFDDGDDALVEASRLRKLELKEGDHLLARLPTEREFTPAALLGWDDDKVHVRWDGGEENWTGYGMIRWPSEGQPRQPAAARNWAEGDRVFACWHDLNWYPGVVLAVNGEQYHVLLDDGNQAMVAADRMRPLGLQPGDRVFCRWKGGPEFYPGEVTNSKGEVIHVQYDDGDEEWTSVRLVRVEG